MDGNEFREGNRTTTLERNRRSWAEGRRASSEHAARARLGTETGSSVLENNLQRHPSEFGRNRIQPPSRRRDSLCTTRPSPPVQVSSCRLIPFQIHVECRPLFDPSSRSTVWHFPTLSASFDFRSSQGVFLVLTVSSRVHGSSSSSTRPGISSTSRPPPSIPTSIDPFYFFRPSPSSPSAPAPVVLPTCPTRSNSTSAQSTRRSESGCRSSFRPSFHSDSSACSSSNGAKIGFQQYGN